MSVETTKLDELFRRLPKNTGIDPRLIEAAKTELDVLKFRSGVHGHSYRQVSWFIFYAFYHIRY